MIYSSKLKLNYLYTILLYDGSCVVLYNTLKFWFLLLENDLILTSEISQNLDFYLNLENNNINIINSSYYNNNSLINFKKNIFFFLNQTKRNNFFLF